MKAVLDLIVLPDDGQLDHRLAKYKYGVFLSVSQDGSSYLCVKDNDCIKKIELSGENKELIINQYEESSERQAREKKLDEIQEMLVRTKKEVDFISKEKKGINTLLNVFADRYLRNTLEKVDEIRGMMESHESVQPESGTSKGYVSEDTLERIIRDIVSNRKNEN